MIKHDWKDIKGESSGSFYSAGKHTVRIDKWLFDTSRSDKLFLQINFEKDGVEKKSDYPFCSCRLYFSSEKSIMISRHYLHLLCDKMGVKYSEDRVENDEAILMIGQELKDREIDILLEPTGRKNAKGYDVLGVNIPDVGELYIKSNQTADTTMDIINTSQQVPDDDIPF